MTRRVFDRHHASLIESESEDEEMEQVLRAAD
jgi:hypothetical protein